MQAEVPFPAEAHERVGGVLELVVSRLGHGVPEQECRDGRRGPIDGVSGVARDVEEKLGIDLRHVDTEVLGEGGARHCGPLAERVVIHPPIIPFRS